MRCKKIDSKCNSKSCPFLQHLPVSRRFDNWEVMFSECPNLIEDKNIDELDTLDFDLDEDGFKQDLEVG